MMICALVEPLLEPYLDGRLVEAQESWVEKHAAGCSACAARLAVGRRLKAALRGAGVPAMPAGLKERLRLSLAEARPGGAEAAQEPAAPDLRPALALAFGLAAMVVFVSGSLIGAGLPSQACADGDAPVCSFNWRNK